MSSTYKVTYFELTGLGEPIRFILSYGGIEFEDIRISNQNWPAFKPTTPLGQLPTLEYNGKIINQSTAICRYLAKQAKLTGKDDWEDLEIDATVDTIIDWRYKVADYIFESNEEVKLKKEAVLINETIPFYFGKLDAQVKKNKGYFVGGKVTWADLYFVSIEEYLSYMTKKDLAANFPNLQIVKNNVFNIPSIKAWVNKRPRNKHFD